MSELQFVKNFPNRAFAEQARQILEKSGIGCVLKSPDVGIMGTSSTSTYNGVDLYVASEDYERSRALLDALFDGI